MLPCSLEECCCHALLLLKKKQGRGSSLWCFSRTSQLLAMTLLGKCIDVLDTPSSCSLSCCEPAEDYDQDDNSNGTSVNVMRAWLCMPASDGSAPVNITAASLRSTIAVGCESMLFPTALSMVDESLAAPTLDACHRLFGGIWVWLRLWLQIGLRLRLRRWRRHWGSFGGSEWR